MKTNLSRWLNELAGQIIEGASDAFLIVAGGSAALQTTTATAQPIDLKHIGVSIAFGVGIYAASFLKKTPTPASMPEMPAPPAPPLP